MRFRPPSIPATVFAVFSLFAAIGLQQPMLNVDGDPPRHIRHGLWMLEHHQLISADPFSFTRPGAPFLGFEYGSQLLMALAHQVGGPAGVVVLTALVIACTYGLLAWVLLRLGVEPLLAYLVTLAAGVLGGGHWSARPHIFTFFAVVVLVWLLERPRPAPVWLFVPFFAVWANIHGGFSFGTMLMGAWLAGALAECLADRTNLVWPARARYLVLAIACAGLGTVINPHGLELHRHILGFFGTHFNIDNTAEFVSPDFHQIDGRIFLIGILITLGVLTFHPRRPTFPRLFVIAMTLSFGLISVRNVALFGLTALPLLALHVNGAWCALPDFRGIRGRFGATAAQASTWPWVGGVVLILALLGINHGRVGSAQVIADRFDASVFPVSAVARARKANLQGHIFSEFVWGGYLVYAWPEQRIFIDGGTDFFGEDLFKQYIKVKRTQPGWRDVLTRWNIELALLRPATTTAHELMRGGNWQPWYCDSVAVLLKRTAAAPLPMTATAADSAERVISTCSRTRGADSASTTDSEE